MGERLNNALALQKRRDLMEAARIAASEEAKRLDNDAWLQREAIKEAATMKAKRYINYKSDVKTKLVCEIMKRVAKGSLTDPSSEEIAITESVINQYVKDKGADKLLNSFKNKTPFLEYMRLTVNKYYKLLTEDTTADDEMTQTMKPETLNDFHKEIDNAEDMEDITNIIRTRVANAEEEFVNQNTQDRYNIKSVMDDTQNRIDSAKPSLDNNYNDETSKEIQEEFARIGKAKIYDIQHNSKRNLFDKLVRKISEKAIEDPIIRENYNGENGRLNIEKIVESVRCIYTVLETISTLNIENVDEKYIKETIESI